MMRCPNFLVLPLHCLAKNNKFYFPLAAMRLEIEGNCFCQIPKFDVIFQRWGCLLERVERQGKQVKMVCIGHNFLFLNFQVPKLQCLSQI